MKHVPPHIAFAITCATRDILEEHGLSAFALPREAALIHEAGHGIVAHAVGYRVLFVKVWEESIPGYAGEVWTGWCQTSNGGGQIDRTCKIADIYKYGRYLIAGLAAEKLAGLALPGSSLDEAVQTQMLATIAVEKLRPGLDPAELRNCAKQVWVHEICDPAVAILRANQGPLEALARELGRLGEVRGKPLRQILAQVPRFRSPT